MAVEAAVALPETEVPSDAAPQEETVADEGLTPETEEQGTTETQQEESFTQAQLDEQVKEAVEAQRADWEAKANQQARQHEKTAAAQFRNQDMGARIRNLAGWVG
mgnify:FL=1